MDIVHYIKKQVYTVTSNYISHSVLIEGKMKGSDISLRCLFVDNSDLVDYLVKKLFDDTPRIIRRWRVAIPLIRSVLKKFLPQVDMCIAVLPQCYEKNLDASYAFKSSEWVHQILDIPSDWEVLREKFRTNPKLTEKKILKYGFRSRISNDIEDLRFFYHSMYRPLIMKQHGINAHLESFEEMEQFFRQGLLMIILDGDVPVSGGLFGCHDDTLVLRRVGVLNSDHELLKKGAQSAVYYFVIRHAQANGMKKVDLMQSRSFINDGVFNHKREWGASVYPDHDSSTRVYFFYKDLSEKIALFFEKNPAIVYSEKGLRGVVGFTQDSNIAVKSVNEYFVNGIHDIVVLTPASEVMLQK